MSTDDLIKKLFKEVKSLSANNTKQLELITSLVNTQDKLVKKIELLNKTHENMQTTIDLNHEISNRILFQVSNLSCKVDEKAAVVYLSASAAADKKESKNSSVDADKSIPTNIMSYFKIKYNNDPKSISHIISNTEVNLVFTKHAADLKNKKSQSLETAKVALIYKELIKGNNAKIKLLREMRDIEIKIKNTLPVENEINETKLDELVDNHDEADSNESDEDESED